VHIVLGQTINYFNAYIKAMNIYYLYIIYLFIFILFYTSTQAHANSVKNCNLFNHLVDSIVSLYELAVKQTKDNEEFLSHLFMAYVRVGNYTKQQQVCLFYFFHRLN